MNPWSHWDSGWDPIGIPTTWFHWDKISGFPAKKWDPNINPGQNILGSHWDMVGFWLEYTGIPGKRSGMGSWLQKVILNGIPVSDIYSERDPDFRCLSRLIPTISPEFHRDPVYIFSWESNRLLHFVLHSLL